MNVSKVDIIENISTVPFCRKSFRKQGKRRLQTSGLTINRSRPLKILLQLLHVKGRFQINMWQILSLHATSTSLKWVQSGLQPCTFFARHFRDSIFKASRLVRLQLMSNPFERCRAIDKGYTFTRVHSFSMMRSSSKTVARVFPN